MVDAAVIDSYRRLLTSQYKTRPKLTAWLKVLLEHGLEYYSTLEEFLNAWDLDDAVGAQLDVIGRIVGVDRLLTFNPADGSDPLMDDDTYRIVIKAKIIKNYWKGTLPELYEAWNVLFPNFTIQIQDGMDMTFTVVIMGDFTLLEQELIAKGYIVPKPEGVFINYTILPPGTPLFAYDIDDQYYSGYTSRWADIIN